MKILAIETSCDETAISVVKASGGFSRPKFEILSNIVASQVKLHAEWGGVVPNLAKREHIKNLPIVLKKAMAKAKMNPEKIDTIAVTIGPGLEPALWTGINFAVELAEKWKKPLIPVNHMEGHIVASLLATKPSAVGRAMSDIKFPTMALLVSGGHTELVLMRDWLKYKIIGQTRDDAVGEAFDKVARMLKLPYPGGPEISKLAATATTGVDVNIALPRPMLHSGDFDFSFSGLKTAVLYKLKELSALESEDKKNGSHRMPPPAASGVLPHENRFLDEAIIASICKEFQQAAIDVLVSKTIKAAEKYKVKTVIMGGGVAANKELRKQMGSQLLALNPQPNFLLPDLKFTTDNAAMIAAAGYLRALKGQFAKNPSRLKAKGNLTLK